MRWILTLPITLSLAAIFGCTQSSEKLAPPKPIAKDAIAVVIGRSLTAKDSGNLRGIILWALLDDFAKKKKVEPTEKELEPLLKKFEEIHEEQEAESAQEIEMLHKELKSDLLSEREREKKSSPN